MSLDRAPAARAKPFKGAPRLPETGPDRPSGGAHRFLKRRRLLDRLEAASPQVVILTAPAGSGKSTLLAQWAEAQRRQVAWLSCVDEHLEPALLVQDLAEEVAAALGDGPVAQAVPRFGGVSALRAVRRLVRAMALETEPALVVLDDVHRLRESPQALDAVATLVDQLPDGWSVAIAERQPVALPLGRWHAQAAIVENLGFEDLAFDVRECERLLRTMGIDVGAALAADVHARTEGWPVGVYLTALALRAQRSEQEHLVSGDDTLIRSFLESEILAGISETDHELLMQTSIVREVSGSLATAITGLPDAGERLRAIARSLLLVRPTDRSERTFRYHGLLAGLLRRQLEDRHADRSILHRRAAAWFEEHGDTESAIAHAGEAGDRAMVRRLVLEGFNAEYRRGHSTAVHRWMSLVTRGRASLDPQVAVAAALVAALEGDVRATVRAVAAAGAGGPGPLEEVPAGPDLDAHCLRAVLCPHGPELMRADSLRALERHPDDWAWAPLAWTALGSAHRMLGDAAAAEDAFAALERTSDGASALARLVARAERAHAAMDRHDWTTAESILQADAHFVLDILDPERVASALWLAADARLRARRGDTRTAADRLRRAQLSRARLTWAVPWYGVRSLTEIARAQLLAGDTGGARTSLAQAREIIEARPGLGILRAELDETLQRALRAGEVHHGVSTLSPAELRLLPLLQTYLTFKEIGDRLSISPNTVKTEVLSIYAKLGASSRSEAVEVAVEAGLLEDPFR